MKVTFSNQILLIGSLLTGLVFVSHAVSAGEADVLAVKASCNAKNKCRFIVRVKHKDTSWNHYANRWEILSLDGEILATRVLAHPHIDEQPFIRSLTVEIAQEHKSVKVRAHDLEHGYGGKEVVVILRK